MLTVSFHKASREGSCLGPFLFVSYAWRLFKVVEKYLPNTSCFADDTQLYLSFKADNNTSQPKDIGNMNSIDDLRNWMIMEKLMINDDKTKTKFFVCSITDGKYDIDPALCVRSRRVVCMFNTKFCNAAFYYFHNKY